MASRAATPEGESALGDHDDQFGGRIAKGMQDRVIAAVEDHTGNPSRRMLPSNNG
jgi:hypothetical protein